MLHPHFGARIERVTQAIAEDVEREHGEDDRDARREREHRSRHDQLLAKGYVGRGYLGAGLQPLRPRNGKRDGILVISIDPEGPAARAGLLVGDIVTAWNAAPVNRVREVMQLLGPGSIGSSVDLALSRGGAAAALKIVIGERPLHQE